MLDKRRVLQAVDIEQVVSRAVMGDGLRGKLPPVLLDTLKRNKGSLRFAGEILFMRVMLDALPRALSAVSKMLDDPDTPGATKLAAARFVAEVAGVVGRVAPGRPMGGADGFGGMLGSMAGSMAGADAGDDGLSSEADQVETGRQATARLAAIEAKLAELPDEAPGATRPAPAW